MTLESHTNGVSGKISNCSIATKTAILILMKKLMMKSKLVRCFFKLQQIVKSKITEITFYVVPFKLLAF